MDAFPPTAADLAWSAAQENERKSKSLEQRLARVETVLGIVFEATYGGTPLMANSPEAEELFAFIRDHSPNS